MKLVLASLLVIVKSEFRKTPLNDTNSFNVKVSAGYGVEPQKFTSLPSINHTRIRYVIPKFQKKNYNTITTRASNRIRPNLQEIQNILSNVEDNSFAPKSKIVEIIRVPAIYEFHIHSDGSGGNTWIEKPLVPQISFQNIPDFSTNDYFNQPVPQFQDLPQFPTSFHKMPPYLPDYAQYRTPHLPANSHFPSAVSQYRPPQFSGRVHPFHIPTQFHQQMPQIHKRPKLSHLYTRKPYTVKKPFYHQLIPENTNKPQAIHEIPAPILNHPQYTKLKPIPFHKPYQQMTELNPLSWTQPLDNYEIKPLSYQYLQQFPISGFEQDKANDDLKLGFEDSDKGENAEEIEDNLPLEYGKNVQSFGNRLKRLQKVLNPRNFRIRRPRDYIIYVKERNFD